MEPPAPSRRRLARLAPPRHHLRRSSSRQISSPSRCTSMSTMGMAEKVLLNTPHVLSALSPANSRYSRPRRRPLRASGRLLGLAAEGDLVAPWRCSCTSRTLVSLGREAKAAPRSAHERAGGRGLCAASGLKAQGARGAFKNAVPAGTWALFESVCRQRMSRGSGGAPAPAGPSCSTPYRCGPLDRGLGRWTNTLAA